MKHDGHIERKRLEEAKDTKHINKWDEAWRGIERWRLQMGDVEDHFCGIGIIWFNQLITYLI